MKENIEENTHEGIDDLEKFYTEKKNEQEALRRLLYALENASKSSKNNDASNKTNKTNN